MIVLDHQASRVSVSVFGEFTLADYREFEEVVNFKIKFEGPVDLYFDMTQMAGLTLDVAWEEVKFSRAHANDFKRVAVVTGRGPLGGTRPSGGAMGGEPGALDVSRGFISSIAGP